MNTIICAACIGVAVFFLSKGRGGEAVAWMAWAAALWNREEIGLLRAEIKERLK